MVIFLFLIHLLGALVVRLLVSHLYHMADIQAVQLFRGDLDADITMSFSQTYIAFLGMYQASSSVDRERPGTDNRSFRRKTGPTHYTM